MNNSKINLMPNGSHSKSYNGSKSRQETFDMHIPDEDDELNVLEEEVEPKSNLKKKSFFDKLKNIFTT